MEWKEVRLGDVCEIKGGKRLPKGVNLITQKNSHPYIRVRDLGKSKTIELNSSYEYVDEITHKQIQRYITQKGDILISIVGTIGLIAIVGGSLDGANLTENCVKLVKLDKIDSEYLYYYLKSPFGQQNISRGTVGAVQAKLPIKNIQDFSIICPELISDQRRIASILSSLDRKIELNNKINADLEEMAQAIFKNWFVDFEPFKDGKFVDSELGMIPEGWKVGRLGELCDFKRGKNLLTKNAIDEGVPVVAGGLEPSCYHNVANTGAPVITVSGSGANAGFMRMYHVPVWASDCSFIDISCENFYFVYCFLKVNSKLLKHAQTGAVQPHVKPSDIHDFELVIPEKESIYDFQDKVKPFFDKIASIQKENSHLSLLRDTLLPRLMSGELEVPE